MRRPFPPRWAPIPLLSPFAVVSVTWGESFSLLHFLLSSVVVFFSCILLHFGEELINCLNRLLGEAPPKGGSPAKALLSGRDYSRVFNTF